MNTNILKAIRECNDNGKRLLDEAEFIEFEIPPSTMLFFSMIAQEEFAKSFLLYLVGIGVIPWNPLILRATRDHKCKQLICVVMDFLNPDTDAFLKRFVFKGIPLDFPPKVADAIKLLRYEKIGRWESNNWVWAEDPLWNREALKVAEGKIDSAKQDSLYVRLGKDGSVASTPNNVTESRAQEEYELGRRFECLMDGLARLERPICPDYERVETTFKTLFTVQTEKADSGD